MGQVRSLPFPADADHIKPRLAVMQSVAGEVVQGGLRNLPLLARVDRCQRIAKDLTRVGTHLDEDDRVPI